ncbi:PAS domain S-box-containing protein/diguanylate cyclase (GGDEF) domain-containing protein [Marinospirillum celere]|uniref:cyclic-guanylate-specific phosphodiesterase n=1 Tax=Marinospirillum celere TaxID=1122252 RepID=A0A1I1I013_9GAMM|nr:GGDEF domain-containing phosphodiesterase [Marinospirillum celere]SFC27558.1 PAS domain S-box-containing protein/diguanylate cyclase (GGDEF) domain-containing protein [Marinospirillum celere]
MSAPEPEHQFLDSYRLFTEIVQQTADLVLVTNTEGKIVYVNPAWESCSGYSREEVLGERPSLLNSGKHDKAFFSRLWATLVSGQSAQEIVINKNRQGELFYEEKTLTPVRNEQGQIVYFVSIGKDITRQLQQEDKLTYLTHFDALTDLPNRRLLADRLDQRIREATQNDSFALLCLGLDRFKTINESLGNRLGDELLQQTASRLQQILPGQVTISRSSGDEFLILLHNIKNSRAAAYIAHKIIHELERPFELGETETYISASVGITLYPHDGKTTDQLLSNADIALHRAKQAGGQNYHYFTDELTRDAVSRFQMENQLRQALLHKEFYLEYQPRISLVDGSVRGVEALIRWQKPDGTRVSPAEFIPQLEEMGLITSVGEWVLHTACLQARSWQQAGLPEFKVSVNLSAKQFVQKDLCQIVDKCLAHAGLDSSFLELEVTESLMIEDLQTSVRMLQNLKNMGISLAIDDFGAGYSSLGYLKHLPVDTLKIDKGFVDDLATDVADAAIVQAVISMAHRMGLEVTAEGVEEPDQLDLLVSLGCEEVQGFYLARPMLPEILEDWLLKPKAYSKHLLPNGLC